LGTSLMNTISRESLIRWLSGVLEKYQVMAPVIVEGYHLFRPISSPDEIAWDYYNSVVPPKELIFPLTESLFTLDYVNGEPRIEEPVIDRETVIFGLRPCDARAIAMLDASFLSDPVDSPYARRRALVTLVGWACVHPEAPCFCVNVGGAPSGTEGLDALLTEGSDGYFVEALTDKGKSILTGAELTPTDLKPPTPDALPVFSTEGITEKLAADFVSPYWQEQVEACISCKICTFLCPTCYCFDVRDRKEGEAVERLRCWDSCQAAHYSRIAGGYNPRATKTARWKQFFYHKFLYYPERFGGVICCVGCGRCVRKCPVNIDIREVIHDLKEGIPA